MPTKTKFTAAVKTRILDAKRIGASNATAAAWAGINEDTLRRWLLDGKTSAEGSAKRVFHDEFRQAEVEPNLKALAVIQTEVEENKNPTVAMKFLERKEPGFAPPAPAGVAVPAGPVVIHLTLGGSPRMPAWIEGEVIDAPQSPALGPGDGDTAASGNQER
jgi:hypothetical protein